MEIHGQAKKKFDEIVKRKGFTTDLEELEMGCFYWSEFHRVRKEIDDLTYKDRTISRLNPLVRYMNECRKAWTETAKKYGLTPYDDRKLKVGEKNNSKKKKMNPNIPLRKAN